MRWENHFVKEETERIGVRRRGKMGNRYECQCPVGKAKWNRTIVTTVTPIAMRCV